MALNHISCLLLSARAGPGLLDSGCFLCLPLLWPGSSVAPALLPGPGSVEPPWEPCGISGSWGCQGPINAPCPHSPAPGGPPSPQTPGPGRLRGHEPRLPCASLRVLTPGRLRAPSFGHGDPCASSPVTGLLKHRVVVLLVGKHASQQCHLSCCEGTAVALSAPEAARPAHCLVTRHLHRPRRPQPAKCFTPRSPSLVPGNTNLLCFYAGTCFGSVL